MAYFLNLALIALIALALPVGVAARGRSVYEPAL